jgi:hypothetical protein
MTDPGDRVGGLLTGGLETRTGDRIAIAAEQMRGRDCLRAVRRRHRARRESSGDRDIWCACRRIAGGRSVRRSQRLAGLTNTTPIVVLTSADGDLITGAERD